MHVTNANNASRTSLYNIHENDWDDDLLALFDVPRGGLRQVMGCAAEFGICEPEVFDAELPIRRVAGDQQAAAIGYRLGGKTSCALEGSIFVSGAIVQWLCDRLKIIRSAGETEAIATAKGGNNGVHMVLALTGQGAPHCASNARGAIYGITRDTGPADFVRAALESVVYQTNDLFTAIAGDGILVSVVRVDGGITANNWLMQFLADIIDLPSDRQVVRKTATLGVAMRALMQSYTSITLDDLAARWQRDAGFTPAMDVGNRNGLVTGWNLAMKRILTEG